MNTINSGFVWTHACVPCGSGENFRALNVRRRRLVWDADIESDERAKAVRPSGTWGQGRAQVGRETRRWNGIRRTWFAMD